MAGDAGAGFLQGFTQTSVTLEQLQRQREREAEELQIRKEDVRLRRDLLKGQEAHRQLQDIQASLQIQQLLQEQQRFLQDQQRLQGLPGASPVPSGASPPVVVPPRVGESASDLTEQVTRQAPAQPAPQATPAPRQQAPLTERLNNPLAIKQGGQTQYLVDQGIATPGPAATDGGRFLQFRDPAQGLAAADALLQSPLYRDLSVDAALRQWSNQGYNGAVALRVGIDPQTRVADLTPDQRQTLLQGMAQVERGGSPSPGTAPAAAPGAPPEANPEAALRLRGLEQERTALEQQLQQLMAVRTQLTSKRGQEEMDRRITDVRQTLQLKETQLTRLQQQDVPFDKGFVEFFALHHQGQHVREALRAPGGAALVQRARQAYLAQQADEEAAKELTKQQKTQELALQRAREAKALTPIPQEVTRSLAAHKSIYNSIQTIETILREGTDLPADFVNLVAQDAPQIQEMLKRDPKQLTGILQQFATKWGAASQNDPRVNRFLSALGNMRDLVIRERSGAAVTGNELERAIGAFAGSLPNINQAFSLFAQNLANVKQSVVDQLVTMGSTIRPLAGGSVAFESLPPAIRLQILQLEEAASARQQPGTQSPRRVVGDPVVVTP